MDQCASTLLTFTRPEASIMMQGLEPNLYSTHLMDNSIGKKKKWNVFLCFYKKVNAHPMITKLMLIR